MNIFNYFFPEHFTQVDRKAVLGLLATSVLIFIVFLKVNPNFLNRKDSPVAVIEFKSKSVKHKDAFSMSFYETNAGELLQNKDEVFATENALARVRFLNSKNQIIIPSSSLVKIESGIDGDSIEVKEGVVEVALEKMKSLKVMANGKENILLSPNGNQKIKLFMNNGELSVQGDGDSIKLNGKKINKSFEIVYPQAGDVVEVEDAFEVKTNIKSNYKMTLTKDANFEKNDKQINFSGNKYVITQSFEEGSYYLKVDNGKESKIIPITIVSKYKITDMSPNEGEVLKMIPGEKVVLRWSPKPVKKYRVTVKFLDGTEKKYVVDKPELTLNDVRGNSFEWSVSPELAANHFSSIHSKSSVVVKYDGKIELLDKEKKSFKTTDKNLNISWSSTKGETFVVTLRNPITNKIVFERRIKGKNLKLPVTNIGKYNLSISSLEYPSMSKVDEVIDLRKPIGIWEKSLPLAVKSIENEESFKIAANLDKKYIGEIQLKHKFAEKTDLELFTNQTMVKLTGFGKHCFQLVPKTAVEGISDSDEHCVELVKLPPFPPLPRAKDIVMNFERHNGVDTYKITIPEIKNAIKYYFEIYRDESGAKLVYKYESAVPIHYWASNRSGIYYLKYKVSDKKNRFSEFSPASKLIFPISPLSSW